MQKVHAAEKLPSPWRDTIISYIMSDPNILSTHEESMAGTTSDFVSPACSQTEVLIYFCNRGKKRSVGYFLTSKYSLTQSIECKMCREMNTTGL